MTDLTCPHCGKPIPRAVIAGYLGSQTSEVKARSSRENGKKGGWPLNKPKQKICQTCGSNNPEYEKPHTANTSNGTSWGWVYNCDDSFHNRSTGNPKQKLPKTADETEMGKYTERIVERIYDIEMKRLSKIDEQENPPT